MLEARVNQAIYEELRNERRGVVSVPKNEEISMALREEFSMIAIEKEFDEPAELLYGYLEGGVVDPTDENILILSVRLYGPYGCCD